MKRVGGGRAPGVVGDAVPQPQHAGDEQAERGAARRAELRLDEPDPQSDGAEEQADQRRPPPRAAVRHTAAHEDRADEYTEGEPDRAHEAEDQPEPRCHRSVLNPERNPALSCEEAGQGRPGARRAPSQGWGPVEFISTGRAARPAWKAKPRLNEVELEFRSSDCRENATFRREERIQRTWVSASSKRQSSPAGSKRSPDSGGPSSGAPRDTAARCARMPRTSFSRNQRRTSPRRWRCSSGWRGTGSRNQASRRAGSAARSRSTGSNGTSL